MPDTDVTAQGTIDNSLSRARDPKKTQWDDAQMMVFVNRAVDYIHKLLIRIQNELAISTGTITMTATQEFSLEDNMVDFWAMSKNGVYFEAVGIPLNPITYDDKIRVGTDTTDADPKSYYITATNLGVVNTPTVTSIAAYPTLICRYFKQNTSLVLADNMPYKNLFNEPIIAFADHMAVVKKGNQSQEYTAIYNALEKAALEIAASRVPT